MKRNIPRNNRFFLRQWFWFFSSSSKSSQMKYSTHFILFYFRLSKTETMTLNLRRQVYPSTFSILRYLSTARNSRLQRDDDTTSPRSKFNFIANAAEKTAKSVVYIEVHNDAINRLENDISFLYLFLSSPPLCFNLNWKIGLLHKVYPVVKWFF